MVSFRSWLAALSLSSAVAAIPPPGCHKELDYHLKAKIADQYLRMWNGEHELAESTFLPEATLFQDRVSNPPNGTLSMNSYSRDGILFFMTEGPRGWDKYQFEVVHTIISRGPEVVVRWKLDGVVGANMYKPTPRPQGYQVTYNGTDILYLDDCSGLIKQIDSAQDYFTLHYNLGFKEIIINGDE